MLHALQTRAPGRHRVNIRDRRPNRSRRLSIAPLARSYMVLRKEPSDQCDQNQKSGKCYEKPKNPFHTAPRKHEIFLVPLGRQAAAPFLLSLALLFHLFAPRASEECQTMNPRLPLAGREPRQQSPHTRRIEDRLCFPQAHSRCRDAKLEPPPVFAGALPPTVSAADRP